MKQLRMILVALTILNLFGCVGKENALTSDTIANLQDDRLEQAIIDNIHARMNSSLSNEEEVVRNLRPGPRAIYMTWLVEAEVSNGGFNQYYFNSSGQLADLGEEAFTTIGARKFASLVGRAHVIYNEIKGDLEKYKDGTIESFSKSYEGNPLNELDDEFYKLDEVEPLGQLKIKYIRENLKEFVGD